MRTLPLDVNSAFRFFWKALAPPVTFAVSLSPYLSQIRDALLGRPGG
jgi:hypothetical protein